MKPDIQQLDTQPHIVKARLLLLVIDPDQITARAVAAGLRRHHIDVVTTSDPVTGLRHAAELLPDAVLICADVPPPTAARVARQLRGRHRIPVIVGTHGAEVGTKIAGALASVPHPYCPADVLAILHAVAPEPDGGVQSALEVDALYLNPATGEVRLHGELVGLAEPEVELLQLLMLHAGRVVTPVQLDQLNWSGDERYPSTVARRLASLRAQLGDDGNLIEDMPGLGHRLNAMRRGA